ncbi:MAG: hypothetical protein R2764_18775 [Bacteroidales bacterium]
MKISDKLIIFLRSNDLGELLGLNLQSFSKKDIIKWIKESNDILSFMIRHIKPIMQKNRNQKFGDG